MCASAITHRYTKYFYICRPRGDQAYRSGGCTPQDAVNHAQTISTKRMCSHGSPTVGCSTSYAWDPLVQFVNFMIKYQPTVPLIEAGSCRLCERSVPHMHSSVCLSVRSVIKYRKKLVARSIFIYICIYYYI